MQQKVRNSTTRLADGHDPLRHPLRRRRAWLLPAAAPAPPQGTTSPRPRWHLSSELRVISSEYLYGGQLQFCGPLRCRHRFDVASFACLCAPLSNSDLLSLYCPTSPSPSEQPDAPAV